MPVENVRELDTPQRRASKNHDESVVGWGPFNGRSFASAADPVSALSRGPRLPQCSLKRGPVPQKGLSCLQERALCLPGRLHRESPGMTLKRRAVRTGVVVRVALRWGTLDHPHTLLRV